MPSLANVVWGGIMGGVAGTVSGSIKGIVGEQAGKGADLLQTNVKNAATSIDLSPPAHAPVERMIPPKVPHHPVLPTPVLPPSHPKSCPFPRQYKPWEL